MLLNKERALGVMADYGLDALIASTPNNVTYLSDFGGWTTRMYQGQTTQKGLQNYAVLPRREDMAPCVIIPLQEGIYVSMFPLWMEEVRTFGSYNIIRNPENVLRRLEERGFEEILDASHLNSPTAGEELVKALKEKGLDNGKIGVDWENMSPHTVELLRRECPKADFQDACDLFRYIRIVKTEEELKRLRRAAQTNEAGYQAVVSTAQVGVSELELRQAYLEAVAHEGGIFEFYNSPCGSRSGAWYPPCDNRLVPGDVMLFDCGCIWNHYHADTGGSCSMGEPSEKAKKLYRAQTLTVEAALDMVKPGTRPSEIFSLMTETLRKNGVERIMTYGHGIGIEGRDLPIIAAETDVVTPVPKPAPGMLVSPQDPPLEANTVLNIEVPTCEFGWGGLQLEHSVVVTKAGWELLIPRKPKLEVK